LRLQHSLDGIKLANPYRNAEWASIIGELIARNAPEDQYIYLHITRGVAKRDHAFPNPPVKPTVFIMSNPLLTPPAELLQSGIACLTAPDNRWLRCDIKAISLLPNVLLRQMAVDAGYAETILIRDNEFMTEGAASNIFVVQDGKLLAPPKDNLMLPGITYDVVLEIAAANGIPCEVRRVLKEEVFAADELLLTSSTKEVLAITTLDGKPVGNGKPGAMFVKLHQLYQEFKRDVMRK
jgi:D-alanine transaminase